MVGPSSFNTPLHCRPPDGCKSRTRFVAEKRRRQVRSRDPVLWLGAILAGSALNIVLFAIMATLGVTVSPPRPVKPLTVGFIPKKVVTSPAPVTATTSVPGRKTVHRRKVRKPPKRKRLHSVARQGDKVVPDSPENAPQRESADTLSSDTRQEAAVLPQPVPVYQLTGLPRFIHKEQPHYPEGLRKLGREATVKLEVFIEADGRIRYIKVLKSAGPEFDHSAVAAIRASTFAPGNIDGRPVPVLMRLPVRFKLR